MKILLWTRPNDNIKGGDIEQARITSERLLLKGAETTLRHDFDLPDSFLNEFDIIHLFVLVCSNVISKTEKVKRLNKKIVVSLLYRDPNYYE